MGFGTYSYDLDGIGVVASFVLVLISEGLHQIITCGLVAFLVGGILYYGIMEKSDLRLLASIASAIVAFFLYFLLYSHANEGDLGDVWAWLVFFIPYVIFAYLLFGINSKTE